MTGKGVLGDDDLLKRSSVVLEQTDNCDEQLDGHEGRQRCGDGGCDNAGAGEGWRLTRDTCRFTIINDNTQGWP
jgi:hypothetical protein